jgi:hypothetical protein
MQRPTAERREARAENHAGIEVIGACHHAVSQSALGLIEHGFDQLAS